MHTTPIQKRLKSTPLNMSENSHNPEAQSSQPIGIIAGGGHLPVSLAKAVVKSGRDVFICALEEFGDPELNTYPHQWVSIQSVEEIIKQLKQANCRKIVMIGNVKRPNGTAKIPGPDGLDNTAAQLLNAGGGDDRILSGIADFLEKLGFSVIGAHELIPENLIGNGAVGGHVHTADDVADIAKGFEVLSVMGNLDVGQAVVVCGGYVLAIEAAEGTDEMLKRVAKLRKDGVVHKAGGVLVKKPKSGQDKRFDMPVIGPATIELVAAAGLSGIVVDADNVLCHDRSGLVARADELGIFVEGANPSTYGKADS